MFKLHTSPSFGTGLGAVPGRATLASVSITAARMLSPLEDMVLPLNDGGRLLRRFSTGLKEIVVKGRGGR